MKYLYRMQKRSKLRHFKRLSDTTSINKFRKEARIASGFMHYRTSELAFLLLSTDFWCWCVCVCVCVLSRVLVFVTPWTATHRASLSLGFSRQEYRSGLPYPSPFGAVELIHITILVQTLGL